ncbi:MAG: 3-deoxy-manno-octulosonate cytidylyltransferase [Candidatus Krumholzibacteriota bacterium]
MAKEFQGGADKVLVVIPARFDSTRFPGKALADLAGKPLIVRVAEMAAGIGLADEVVVATDDTRIQEAVLAAGFRCEMTGSHATGTDRIGEVAGRHDADIVLNLQGDEPLLDSQDIDGLIKAMRADPGIDLATCAHRFADRESWNDPNQVKVIRDVRGEALYFSRAPIPGTFPGAEARPHEQALRHVGIYAFRQKALQRFLSLDRTPLEISEGLEQLRALENGMRIKVLDIANAPVGVDTPDDLEVVRRLWNQQRGS